MFAKIVTTCNTMVLEKQSVTLVLQCNNIFVDKMYNLSKSIYFEWPRPSRLEVCPQQTLIKAAVPGSVYFIMKTRTPSEGYMAIPTA